MRMMMPIMIITCVLDYHLSIVSSQPFVFCLFSSRWIASCWNITGWMYSLMVYDVDRILCSPAVLEFLLFTTEVQIPLRGFHNPLLRRLPLFFVTSSESSTLHPFKFTIQDWSSRQKWEELSSHHLISFILIFLRFLYCYTFFWLQMKFRRSSYTCISLLFLIQNDGNKSESDVSRSKNKTRGD